MEKNDSAKKGFPAVFCIFTAATEILSLFVFAAIASAFLPDIEKYENYLGFAVWGCTVLSSAVAALLSLGAGKYRFAVSALSGALFALVSVAAAVCLPGDIAPMGDIAFRFVFEALLPVLFTAILSYTKKHAKRKTKFKFGR